MTFKDGEFSDGDSNTGPLEFDKAKLHLEFLFAKYNGYGTL